MKQGGLILASFVLMFASVTVPIFAHDSKIDYTTYMVETFDSPDTSGWTWQAVGSKFIANGYPVLKYFDGMPRAIEAMHAGDGKTHRFLGVQTKFDRQGNNWFDIIPVKDGKPYEIPLKGVVSRFDIWVWGANYLYSLEILVRDSQGLLHSLPLGWLTFNGWQNLAVSVPSTIPQSSHYIGTPKHLSFVAFRVRTSPIERVNDFYIFLDQFKALSNIFVDSYDGYLLENADFGKDTKGDAGK